MNPYQSLVNEVFDGRRHARFVPRPKNVLGHVTWRVAARREIAQYEFTLVIG